MAEAYIIDAVRTPVGKRGGSFAPQAGEIRAVRVRNGVIRIRASAVWKGTDVVLRKGKGVRCLRPGRQSHKRGPADAPT